MLESTCISKQTHKKTVLWWMILKTIVNYAKNLWKLIGFILFYLILFYRTWQIFLINFRSLPNQFFMNYIGLIDLSITILLEDVLHKNLYILKYCFYLWHKGLSQFLRWNPDLIEIDFYFVLYAENCILKYYFIDGCAMKTFILFLNTGLFGFSIINKY